MVKSILAALLLLSLGDIAVDHGRHVVAALGLVRDLCLATRSAFYGSIFSE